MYLRLGMMPHEFAEAPAPSRYFIEQAMMARLAGEASGVGFEHERLLDDFLEEVK